MFHAIDFTSTAYPSLKILYPLEENTGKIKTSKDISEKENPTQTVAARILLMHANITKSGTLTIAYYSRVQTSRVDYLCELSYWPSSLQCGLAVLHQGLRLKLSYLEEIDCPILFSSIDADS